MDSEGLQGTHMEGLNPFNSKLMTLILMGGLWTFSAILALCTSPRWPEGHTCLEFTVAALHMIHMSTPDLCFGEDSENNHNPWFQYGQIYTSILNWQNYLCKYINAQFPKDWNIMRVAKKSCKIVIVLFFFSVNQKLANDVFIIIKTLQWRDVQ